MLIMPAIDLKDGEVVRLYKGDYNQKKVYSSNPASIAKKFEEIGADLLHLVDLDGAKDGYCKNIDVIKQIRNTISIPIEIGGGIRDEETIKKYLEEIGIDRVILGTKALQDEKFLKDMVDKYGSEKIVVGVDIKEKYVSINGWLENSDIYYIDFIKKIEKIGVKHIVVTDISKDGTLNGPNFSLYEEIAKNSNINIVVSGGIHTESDVYEANDQNYYGCIIGKAYYENKINLEEVVSCLKKG